MTGQSRRIPQHRQPPPGVVLPKQGKRRRERSVHLPETFGIGFGRTLAVEYHDRTVELGISLVPIVLPVARLYGADDAPFLRVGVALPVGRELRRSRAAK